MAGLDERVALSTDLRDSPPVIVRQDHLRRRGGRRGRKHENEEKGQLCPGSHLRRRWLPAVARTLSELLYLRLASAREGAPGPELRTCASATKAHHLAPGHGLTPRGAWRTFVPSPWPAWELPS